MIELFSEPILYGFLCFLSIISIVITYSSLKEFKQNNDIKSKTVYIYIGVLSILCVLITLKMFMAISPEYKFYPAVVYAVFIVAQIVNVIRLMRMTSQKKNTSILSFLLISFVLQMIAIFIVIPKINDHSSRLAKARINLWIDNFNHRVNQLKNKKYHSSMYSQIPPATVYDPMKKQVPDPQDASDDDDDTQVPGDTNFFDPDEF